MKNINTENINKTLILSIVGVISFVLAIFGITYAFFSISVSGNDQASSIIVNIADLGIVTFEDGNVINAENIYPMEVAERISKTFTIQSVGNTVDVDYVIYMTVTANTFIQQYENEFTYTLNYVNQNTSSVVTNVSNLVPGVGKHQIGTGVLSSGGDIHIYTFTIGLNEVGSNQNSNQSKEFSGILSVEGLKYTHDRSVWGE